MVFSILIFYSHVLLSKGIWIQSSFSQTFFQKQFIIPNVLISLKGLYFIVTFIGIFLIVFLVYRLLFEMWLGNQVDTQDVTKLQEKSQELRLPWDKSKLQMIIGVVHNKLDTDLVEEPKWLVVEEKGVFQNFLITGSIGTGKTASVLYPLTKQALFYECDNQKKKAGMLILDVKGNYYKQIVAYAKECSREDDIILIELGGYYNYNPIHKPNMEVIDLAERVRTVLELFNNGGKKEAFWDTKAGQMMAESIRLLRMVDGYVTLEGVHNIVTNTNFLEQKLIELEEMKYDSKGNIKDFDYNSCVNYFTGEFANGAKNTIETIKSCVTEMTGFFASSERINQSFCPPMEQLKFLGFADVINSGKTVVLNMNVAEYPKVAKTISAFMKLDFQAEVQLRTTGKGLNTTRPVFFICDEYQEFVTSNDGNFYGVSREAKCSSIVASQSYTSMMKTLGDEKSFNTLQQNMLNKIWLRTDDKATIDMAQTLTGKEIKAQYSKNISESAGDTKRSALFGKLVSDKASISESIGISTKEDFVFATNIFTQTLKMFKAIAFVSDGEKMKEPTIVHLLPYFNSIISDSIKVDLDESYKISFEELYKKKATDSDTYESKKNTELESYFEPYIIED